MVSKRIVEQRETIKSALTRIVEISQDLDPMMSDEKHSKGIAFRSLGKNGYLLHFKSGGISGVYLDQNGQRYEVKVSPIIYDKPNESLDPIHSDIGKAYGFFDCNATKEEIEKEIPFIRECVQTPNELELQLMEGIDGVIGDFELLNLGEEAKDAGIKYVMIATYPNATNRKTADELSSIINQAYQSPLYEKGESFRGEIFFKELGKYIARD